MQIIKYLYVGIICAILDWKFKESLLLQQQQKLCYIK